MGFISSFLSFMYDMLHDLFTGGWLGVSIGILIVLIIVIIVGLVMWGVLYAIDSWFRPEVQEPGVIDGHDFTPAHTTWMMMPTSNGGTVPVPQYIPDSWSIGVRVGSRHSWMSCSKDCHDKYKNGQKIIATFTNGRLSRRMYVQAISRT